MSFDEFSASLAHQAAPPSALALPLQALWLDAKGDWVGAHTLVQTAEASKDGRNAAWVHAYLHRKEGDEDNAAYWYARARRPVATDDLQSEWRVMVTELLMAGRASR